MEVLLEQGKYDADHSKEVLDRKPTLPGVARMVEWWNGYDQVVRAQRQRVTKVYSTFTDEDRKRIQVYIHSWMRHSIQVRLDKPALPMLRQSPFSKQ